MTSTGSVRPSSPSVSAGWRSGRRAAQQQDWQDPLAWVALGVGALATLAVPILMLTRPRPLVPPSLFASRNFTVVNLSTFVIYGALYVVLYFLPVFLQGTLGYTPLAAGAVSIPTALLLTFLSTPAGQLSARFGPRLFMTVGPLLMALGLTLADAHPGRLGALATGPGAIQQR